MPARPRDEDLFAESTMTFGEHLEELRGRLFKSLIALVVCSIVGLIPFAGGNLVALIKAPLESALSAYYETQASDLAREKLEAMRAAGEVLPDDPAKIAEFVSDNHLLPQQVFVDPDEVVSQLRQRDPARFGSLPPVAAGESRDPVASSDKSNVGGSDGSAEPTSKKELIPLFLWRPTADDARMRAKSLSPHEAFLIYVKASLFVGIVLASPFVFYQIWSFVAAGLYPREKHYVHVFLPFSLGLFLAGAATAFFFVFEPVLTFLFSFNRMLGIDIEPRITEWMSFVLVLPLGFGISFQLPLVMLFLERIGIFDVKAYMSKWRVAIMVICVMSMLLTPADPYSMLLMAIPLVTLYFGGVLLCRFMPRRRGRFSG